VIEENTGYLPVDDNINAIQNLATEKLVMKEAGFIEIFVNNDAQTPVYYDNMMVTMSTGYVMEINAYYPSGKILSNFSTNNWLYAPQYNHYKYTAKERQTELGLDWLDYGARMYDPVVGRWWVPDPLAERGYHLSPYSFSFNNPVNFIDPDGRWASPYYDELGKFLGVDEKGFKGDIYITSKSAFDKHSSKGVARSKDLQADADTKFIKNIPLTSEVQSNIFTHAMLRTEGVDFSNLYNNKVSILEKRLWNGKEVVLKGYNDPDDYDRFGFGTTKDGKFKVTAITGSNQTELYSVELIQNSLGVHEYDGHGNRGYSGGRNPGGTHHNAYLIQAQHPTFQFLPAARQEEILLRIREFMSFENPTKFQKHYGSKNK